MAEAAAHIGSPGDPTTRWDKVHQRRRFRSFIHQTYGSFHAQYLISAEHCSQPSSHHRQHAKSRDDVSAQPPSFAEAVSCLVATGIWDSSLAQALEAEMNQRTLDNANFEQAHGGKTKVRVLADACAIARDGREALKHIGKQVYDKVLSYKDGNRRLNEYLQQPGLCHLCFNLREELVLCRNDCGRYLCNMCRTKAQMCPNLGMCRQRTQRWRAAIHLLDWQDPLYAQWQAAAWTADRHTKESGAGRRPATQTAACAHHNSHSLSQHHLTQ